jgi:hypothetical protein
MPPVLFHLSGSLVFVIVCNTPRTAELHDPGEKGEKQMEQNLEQLRQETLQRKKGSSSPPLL